MLTKSAEELADVRAPLPPVDEEPAIVRTLLPLLLVEVDDEGEMTFDARGGGEDTLRLTLVQSPVDVVDISRAHDAHAVRQALLMLEQAGVRPVLLHDLIHNRRVVSVSLHTRVRLTGRVSQRRRLQGMTQRVRHVLKRGSQRVWIAGVDIRKRLPLLVPEEIEVVVDGFAILLAEVGRRTSVDRAVLVVGRRIIGEELLRRVRAVPQRFQHGDHRVVAGTVLPRRVERIVQKAVHLLVTGEPAGVLLMQLRHMLSDRMEELRVIVPVPHDPAEQLIAVRRAAGVVLGQGDLLGSHLAELRPPLRGEGAVARGGGEIQAEVALEFLDVRQTLLVDLRVVMGVRGELTEEGERLLRAELLVESLRELP